MCRRRYEPLERTTRIIFYDKQKWVRYRTINIIIFVHSQKNVSKKAATDPRRIQTEIKISSEDVQSDNFRFNIIRHGAVQSSVNVHLSFLHKRLQSVSHSKNPSYNTCNFSRHEFWIHPIELIMMSNHRDLLVR